MLKIGTFDVEIQAGYISHNDKNCYNLSLSEIRRIIEVTESFDERAIVMLYPTGKDGLKLTVAVRGPVFDKS